MNSPSIVHYGLVWIVVILIVVGAIAGLAIASDSILAGPIQRSTARKMDVETELDRQVRQSDIDRTIEVDDAKAQIEIDQAARQALIETDALERQRRMEDQHRVWRHEQERIDRDYEVQERQQLLRHAARRAETVDWLLTRIGDVLVPAAAVALTLLALALGIRLCFGRLQLRKDLQTASQELRLAGKNPRRFVEANLVPVVEKHKDSDAREIQGQLRIPVPTG